MTCLSDLEQGLFAIAAAIQDSGAGCEIPGSAGTGGAGGSPQAGSTFVDDGTSTFPAGYANRSEYENWKCGLAESIREKWEGDIRRAKIVDLVGLTVSGLLFQFGAVGAVALVTPIPFDDLLVLAAAFFALAALLIDLGAALQQAEDYVVAFDICIWAGANNIVNAIAGTEGDIDAQTFPLGDAQVKTILKSFISTDMLNPLFDPKPAGADYSGVGDCSGCQPCLPIEALLLTDGQQALITEITPGVVYDVEAVFNTINSRWEAIFAFNVVNENPTPAYCGTEMEISAQVISGSVSLTPPPNPWRIFDQAGIAVYQGTNPPPADLCSARWVVVSSAAFTLQVDIGNNC